MHMQVPKKNQINNLLQEKRVALTQLHKSNCDMQSMVDSQAPNTSNHYLLNLHT